MTIKPQPSQSRAAMLYRLLVLCLFSIPTTKGFRWSPFSSKGTATSTTTNTNECPDEDHSENTPRNNDEKKKWWEGVNFEATPSSQSKSKYDSLLQQQQQHDRKAEEALSSMQLEPLLQVPCSVQLVVSSNHNHHRKNNNDNNNNRSFAIGAFLDTGAQRTCMSWEAVQRVGLAHLLDRRYSGQATGVGFCQVLGRIPAHTVLLHFGGGTIISVSSSNSSSNNNINNNKNNENDNSAEQKALVMKAPAITVLGTEGVDLLLGLDFLREAKAVIDLQEECLRLISSTTAKRGGKMEYVIITVPFIRPRQKLSFESEDNMGLTKDSYFDNNNGEDNSDYENDSDVDEEDEESLDLSGL